MLKRFRRVSVLLLLIVATCTCAYASPRHNNEKASAPAQQSGQECTGVVLDDFGDPVIGASVVLKGSTSGAITDIDGNFTLKDIPQGSTLVVSYIGFVSQEVVFRGAPLTIRLSEDTNLMDEIVVVGYGTQKRKNFTGSVATVKAEDTPLSLMPSSNAMDMLRGTTTGLTVSQEQGAGQAPSIMVRGQKSINGGSDPLIVVDGVIFAGAYRDIDPATVESMSILKDATSLAAYGSQAANGVIMITTKKGKIGKPVINLNTSWAFSSAICKPDVLSPENYIKKVNLLNGLDENADPSWMLSFERENYEAGRTTNWFDYSTRTGVMQNYTGSISGATEKLDYFLSGTYTKQEGVVKGDDYNRKVFTARINSDLTSWLQVGGQIDYSFNDYSGPTTYDLYQAVRLSPYGRAERADGGGIEKYPISEGTYRTNPMWTVESGTVDDHDTYAMTSLKGHVLVKCPWIEGLSYRLNASYTLRNTTRDMFYHEGYYVAQGTSDDRYSASTISNYLAQANGSSARTKNSDWVMDHIFSYVHEFGKHFIDLSYVYTRDCYVEDYRYVTGADFSDLGNTNLGAYGLTYAGNQQISSISYTRKTDVGYLGRASYSYDDTYHITASVRRDGSSVFGANHKWGTFPAVGVAWTASNEEFLRKVNVINYLKLKFSWGINGNQSLSPYGTLSKITLGQAGGYSYPFGNTSEVSWGQRITAMGNEDLGWEETQSFNYGFEIGLFENRVHLEFDGYFSKTTNQIFNRTIPVMINGLTSMSATMGQVNNWGIEWTLSTVNIKKKDFTWESSLSFYLNRNKLKELYGDGEDDITNSLFLGKSLGAIYGYKDIGIVQEEDVAYMEANGAIAGDVKFADLDGDGKITSDDRTILGYTKENFRMSFGNTFRYKDFELYFLLTGVFGGNGYGRAVNIYAYRTASDVAGDSNLNHGWWTAENRSNKYPRVDYTNGNYTPTQCWGFVRLQDLSLSYTFRQPAIKNFGIQNLKVYFACKNLFTISPWEGGDPEIQQTLGSGYSYGYPLSRTFSFGLNITF